MKQLTEIMDTIITKTKNVIITFIDTLKPNMISTMDNIKKHPVKSSIIIIGIFGLACVLIKNLKSTTK